MKRILIFITLLCLAACNPGPGISSICNGVSLASASGHPGKRVGITGIPDNITKVEAAMSGAENEGSIPLFTVFSDESGYEVLLPFHPSGIGGGEVQVKILLDSAGCEETAVEILQVDPAPGEFASYVSSLQDYARLVRQTYGVGQEMLLTGDLDELPAILIPIALMQFALEGPDNPNSLLNIAGGSAPILQDYPLDQEVLDAMTAQLGLNTLVQEFSALQKQDLADRLMENALASARFAPVHRPLYGVIGDAEELSSAMAAQHACMSRLTGATGQLLNDADLASGVIGVFNGVAGNLIGLALLIHKAPTEACAYLNPSTIVGMEVEVSPTAFEEDAETPGRVERVMATPQSENWDVAGLMIDILSAGAGGIDSAIDAGRLSRGGVGVVAGPGSDENYVQAANELLGPMVNNICSRSSECSEGQLHLYIDNNPWNAVDIIGPNYVEVNISGEAIAPGEGFGTFKPAKVGVGTVEVWTASGAFGNAAARGRVDVTVDAIIVDIDPDGAELAPEEEACFTVTVSNAVDKGVEWILEAPDGTATGGNEEEVDCFIAPDFPLTPNPDPCLPAGRQTRQYNLTAVSTSTGGARGLDGAEVRSDEAIILVVKTDENIFVRPEGCATPEPTPVTGVCPFGTWILDNQSYLDYLNNIMGTPASGVSLGPLVGTVQLALSTDNTSTLSSNGFNLTFCTQGNCVSADIKYSGTKTFTQEGNVLTFEEGFLTAARGEGTIDLGEDVEVAGESGSIAYTCSGAVMETQFVGLPVLPLTWTRP